MSHPAREAIREFLAKEVGGHVDDASPLFSSGRIDSFLVLELICFLEDRFDVEIDTAKHVIRDFDTIEKIDALLAGIRK